MSIKNAESIPVRNIKQPDDPSHHFRRMDRREWWLWSAAVAVTLLLTAGLASFLLPGLNLLPGLGESDGGQPTFLMLPQVVRGLL